MTVGRLGVLLTAVALAAAGQLVLKHGMVQAQSSAADSGRSLLLVAASSPWIIGGLMIFAASAVAWLLTLARVPLSVAYPFNALGYVAILLASAVVLHERTNGWMWLGTVLVGTGLVLIVVMAPAASASASMPHHAGEQKATVSVDDVQDLRMNRTPPTSRTGTRMPHTHAARAQSMVSRARCRTRRIPGG